MIDTPIKRAQAAAYQIVLYELVYVSLGSGVALLITHEQQALGFLLGGLAHTFPNLALVWLAWRRSHRVSPQRFLATFLAGTLSKLLLSVSLLLIVVKYFPISLLCILLGYMSAVVAFWIASVRYGCSYTQSIPSRD